MQTYEINEYLRTRIEEAIQKALEREQILLTEIRAGVNNPESRFFGLDDEPEYSENLIERYEDCLSRLERLK